MKINVFIGFDTRSDGQMLAYEVCKKSILKNTKYPEKVFVQPLILKNFIEEGIYYREDDKLASTEFTYTRFLTPYLSEYKNFSVFCDSDFLWECDIYKEFLPYMINMYKTNKAVYCVKHDYEIKSDLKMNNLPQTSYPRKNWSSLIIFNCSHSQVKNLTLENVNTQSPKWLHRFEWCEDEYIGELPHTYNYLVGVYDDEKKPKVIHYTDGGPWHYLYQETEFAENWCEYLDEEQNSRLEIELKRQKLELDKEGIEKGKEELDEKINEEMEKLDSDNLENNIRKKDIKLYRKKIKLNENNNKNEELVNLDIKKYFKDELNEGNLKKDDYMKNKIKKELFEYIENLFEENYENIDLDNLYNIIHTINNKYSVVKYKNFLKNILNRK